MIMAEQETQAASLPVWKVLADQHGGIWGEHPDYPVSDWRAEVSNNDTRLGYWDWVMSQMEQDENERKYNESKESELVPTHRHCSDDPMCFTSEEAEGC
jgi:hypothetical protein